jgi:hypothetical protein
VRGYFHHLEVLDLKAKVLHKFTDKYTGEHYRQGDVLDITEARYKEILSVAPLVYAIAQDDAETPSADDATNVSTNAEETAETASDAPSDGFDIMSVRELKEYADRAYKVTFKGGMKKAEIIEELRRLERNGR